MRPTWDSTFMDICKTISKRSTCAKIKTSSIIVKDNNIISIGYNGVPSKMEHCEHYWEVIWLINDYDISWEDFLKTERFREEHHNWSYYNELHAEMNAILQCKTDTTNSVMYTLLSPCINCSKCIISSKIKKVIYLTEYKRDFESSKKILEENGIVFEKYNSF